MVQKSLFLSLLGAPYEAFLAGLIEVCVAVFPIKLLLKVGIATELLLRYASVATAWNGRMRKWVLQRSSLGLSRVPEQHGIIGTAVADLRQDPERLQGLAAQAGKPGLKW